MTDTNETLVAKSMVQLIASQEQQIADLEQSLTKTVSYATEMIASQEEQIADLERSRDWWRNRVSRWKSIAKGVQERKKFITELLSDKPVQQ